MLTPVEHAPLAPRCTLRIGGPARYLVEATDEATVAEAVQWAAFRKLPVRVLGGGSNLVIADEGVDGLVLKIGLRGVTARELPGSVEVTAAAGEPWDDLVRHTVGRGWAGLECLSGIPGLVGATPIQNVGAYGQEVSDTLASVRALDRESGRIVTLAPADCGFGYRDSVFKSRAPGRYVVLAVTYRLVPGGAPYLGYADIAREIGTASPSLPAVRDDRDPGAPLQVHGARPGRSERAELWLVLSESHRGRGRARRHRRARGRSLHAALAAAGRSREALGGLAHRARRLHPRPGGRTGRPLHAPHPGHRLPRRGARPRRRRLRASRAGRRRGALRGAPAPRTDLLGYPEPRLKHGGEVAMADRDLKLNSLARYAKRSPDLILEELSQCEIPAGCGGVVLRWWNPKQGVPVTIWVHSQGGREMGLDGRPVSSGVPLVTFGPFRMGRDGAREDAGGR